MISSYHTLHIITDPTTTRLKLLINKKQIVKLDDYFKVILWIKVTDAWDIGKYDWVWMVARAHGEVGERKE